MQIRTLNQDLNSNSLEVYRGNDGDIYVTVWDQPDKKSKKTPHTVRIGSAGSGHQLPSGVTKALSELASIFEKYKDCETEADAQREELNKPFRLLSKTDVNLIKALIEREGPLKRERLAEFFGIPVQMLCMVEVKTAKGNVFLSEMIDYDNNGRILSIKFK